MAAEPDPSAAGSRAAFRRLRLALWSAVALAGLIAAALFAAPGFGPSAVLPAGGAAVVSDRPYGTPFALVDGDGRPVSEASLRGRPSAVFFGFTHCPDVCPTTLAEMAALREELGAAGIALRLVFVSVDPERDTPAVMKSYASAVSPAITGLTGAPDAVAAMLKGWGVHAKRVPLDGGGYTMDHTATVLLLDPEGRLAGTLAWGEDRDAMLAKLRRLVRA